VSAGERRKRRAADEAAARAIAETLRNVECSSCGRIFEGEAAHVIGHEDGRCLPDGAYGQLVRLKDGRWGQRYRHPEVR